MLRSYTRAINIQEHRSGALFREETKAICLNNFPSRSSLWHHSQGITYIHISIPEWQYPQVCFNYIHNNPVKARLVADARDWEFSSLSEIINNRTDALVNMERIHGLGLNYG
jgi:putative transposase